MRKSPPADFEIHVDPSCLTDTESADPEMPSDRNASSETIVHHDPEPKLLEEQDEEHQHDSELEQAEEKDEIQELLDELSQHDNASDLGMAAEGELNNDEDNEQDIPIVEEHNEEHKEEDDDDEWDRAVKKREDDEENKVEDNGQNGIQNEGQDEENQANESAYDGHEVEGQRDAIVDAEQNEQKRDECGLQEEQLNDVANQISEHDESMHEEVKSIQDEHDGNNSEEERPTEIVNEREAGDEVHEDEEDIKRREKEARRAERVEAAIQEAARTVVASIEQEYDTNNEDSVLSTQTDESYDQSASELTFEEGTELTYGQSTELSYGDGTELTYEGTDGGEIFESNTEEPEEHHEHLSDHNSDHPSEHGDSSSQHDGDIDEDDVFSQKSGQSKRSSLNSSDGHHSGEEAYQGKVLVSPQVGEEAAPEESLLSPLPSITSFRDSTPQTPTQSKVLSRPPFRTPSDVRKMQMSSPTPSLYASPRSTKRQSQTQNPTVSRLGSRRDSEFSQSRPFSTASSMKSKTPTRVFKTKVEHPLVLLHVTVLPLRFQYADIMTLSDDEIPGTMLSLKDNWRLLQEKLGEQVFARGVLLSHPQDSYEVLEERLLETLELPVRPRAKILKCGHYMGPDDPSTAEESEDDLNRSWGSSSQRPAGGKAWCDICCRNVQFEGNDLNSSEKKFNVKIYASNGLMKAGAWAAAWREMERVDVEIEPFVHADLLPELENLLLQYQQHVAGADEKEHFEERHETGEVPGGHAEQEIRRQQVEEEQRQQAEVERRQKAEEEFRQQAEEDHLRQQAQEAHDRQIEEEEARRNVIEEERIRDIYCQPSGRSSRTQSPTYSSHSRSHTPAPKAAESFSEHLLAAFKLAIRDQKSILICVLSVIILVLALKPGASATNGNQAMQQQAYVPQKDVETAQVGCAKETISNPLEAVEEMTTKVDQVVTSKVKKAIKKKAQPVVEVEVEIEEEEEEVEVEVEVARKPQKVIKKPAKQVPPPVPVAEVETDERQVPKVKKVTKKVATQQIPKMIDPKLPAAVEEDEEEFGVENPIASKSPTSETEMFDLEIPAEEEVQPVDKDHFHIEPPTQKKLQKKNAIVNEKSVEQRRTGVQVGK